MAVNSGSERLGYGGADGCVALGLHRNVISEGAGRTLLSKESGSLVLFDIAGATTFTLPRPEAGMVFEFGTVITGTGTWKITTGVASILLKGGVQIGSETAGGHDSFAANGTDHVSLIMDADTKGRINGGGQLRFVGVSTTLWHVSGWLVGAGTVATPFTNTI